MEPKPWALIGPMAKFRSFMTSPSTAATVSLISGEKIITEVVLHETGKHTVKMAHLVDGETIMVAVIVDTEAQTLQIDSKGLGKPLHVDMSIGIYMKPNNMPNLVDVSSEEDEPKFKLPRPNHTAAEPPPPACNVALPPPSKKRRLHGKQSIAPRPLRGTHPYPSHAATT